MSLEKSSLGPKDVEGQVFMSFTGKGCKCSPFMVAVAQELRFATAKHPPIPSLHAAYGIIKEEFEEFWEEVRKQDGERDRTRLLQELVQTAAMCARAAEDLGLCPKVG